MSNQDPAQEITIVPVDENNRPLVFSDVKIDKVDRDYRTVREPEGLKWTLQPGNYTVKVFLRNMEMKSIPITIQRGVLTYRLPVPTTPAPTTFEFGGQTGVVVSQPPPADNRKLSGSDPDMRKRFPISFPVSYKTDTGQWTKANAVNVSASGICVENLARVTENDNLYVKLHVPVATVPIECPARVVWVMSNDSKKSFMGLQLFLTANMRESLDRWLGGM
jgi:hypothetical protein